MELAAECAPDLVLLDLMLPGIDGRDVCRIIRADQRLRHIPIIMLTAKSEEADVVAGLELGADDYITKPFSTSVLLARVKALLRRERATPHGAETGSAISHNGVSLDSERREVSVDGRPVELTFTEFEVLHMFLRKPGVVFARQQIVNSTKGSDYPVTERAVDVQIVGLRKKLGSKGALIETIRGVGYKLK